MSKETEVRGIVGRILVFILKPFIWLQKRSLSHIVQPKLAYNFDLMNIDRIVRNTVKVGEEILLPSGVKATVIGFPDLFIGRYNSYAHLPVKLHPGIYENRFVLKVQFADVSVQLINTDTFVQYADEALSAKRLSEWIEPIGPKTFKRIGDLPELPFWETDEVLFEGKKYIVYSIDYTNEMYILSDGKSRVMAKTNIELVSRGNLWNLYHGENLVFESWNEESSFYVSQGAYTVIDVNLEFPSTIELLEYLAQLLRIARGDVIMIGNMFGLKYTLLKFDNDGVGSRLRPFQLAELNSVIQRLKLQ